MKKRLAKKITSIRYSNRIWLRYKAGGPWPNTIHRVAAAHRRLLRSLPYERTMKLVRAMDRGLTPEEVIRRWSDLRRYILRGFRPSDRVPEPVGFWPDEDPEVGGGAGPGSTLQTQIKDLLFYFSDRWHITRIQWMDHAMTKLAEAEARAGADAR